MASGDSLADLDILGGIPPASNYASLDMTAAPFAVAEFDDAVNEAIYLRGRMPSNYDGTSSIKAVIPWKFATFVGSQTCAWLGAFYRIADDADSIEAYTFAADQASGAVAEASATGETKNAEITFTNAQADGIQPGEAFIFRLTRDAASGTASPGDAQVGQVYLKVA